MTDYAAFNPPRAGVYFGGDIHPEYAATFVANVGLSVSSPPAITNHVPALGAIERYTRIGFDVTDDGGIVEAFVIMVGYSGNVPSDVAYYRTLAKSGFCGRYFGDVESLDDGYRFANVGRFGGWLGAPTFYTLAIDPGGAYG